MKVNGRDHSWQECRWCGKNELIRVDTRTRLCEDCIYVLPRRQHSPGWKKMFTKDIDSPENIDKCMELWRAERAAA